MPEDQQNPYVAVLADLERQRDQINLTISTIKRMMGISGDEPLVATTASAVGLTVASSTEDGEIRSDTFFGMSISEAIKKYLGMVKRPKRVSEITKALEQGGYPHTSKSFIGTVQTTLTRMKGVVVRVPNGWGLVEWYPGRNFERAVRTPDVRPKQVSKASQPNRSREPAKKGTKVSKSTDTGSKGLSKARNASLQTQIAYISLLKKFSEDERQKYKAMAQSEGREKAISAMQRALGSA